MLCLVCKHSRKVVNRKSTGRVGCLMATDNDWVDERIRTLNLDIKEEFIYPDIGSTVRTMGVTVSESDSCPYFMKRSEPCQN